MSDPIALLMRARCPEDVFGDLSGPPAAQIEAVRHRYRQLALATHPDSHRDNPQAEESFKKLHELRDAAINAIQAGTYGGRRAVGDSPIVVQSRSRAYTVQGPPRAAGLADLFPAVIDDPPKVVLLKVAHDPADNDLLAAEAAALRHLRSADRAEAKGFWPLLPEIIDSFDLNQAGVTRRVNAFTRAEGFYTLTQVQRAFPLGLDPKHMAWIFRQLLLALGYVHTRGVIHGSVLPPHVLIHPAHDLLLVDFTAAVRDPQSSGEHIPVMSDRYADWYPPEVTAKQPPTPATDIAMAARCMRYLLAGRRLHPRLQGLLAWCELPTPARRPPDAWAARDEFTGVIESLWGPRRRIPFTMPITHTK